MATGGKGATGRPACSLCLKEYMSTEVWDCGHNICDPCSKQRGVGDNMGCPVCRGRAFVDLPCTQGPPKPTAASELQQKMTKLMVAGASQVKMSCDKCGAVHAVGMCQTCMVKLCDTCLTKHKKGKRGKSHHLFHLSNKNVCPEHSQNLITLYCRECVKGMCVLCVGNEHDKHSVVAINDDTLLQEKKQALAQYTASVSQCNAEDIRFLAQVETFPASLDEKYKSEIKTLHENRDNFVQAVKQLQDELQEAQDTEKKKLAIYSRDLKLVNDTKSSLLAHIDNIQHTQSTVDIILAADDLPQIQDTTGRNPPTVNLPNVGDSAEISQRIKALLKFESSRLVPTPVKQMGPTAIVSSLWDVDTGVAVCAIMYDPKCEMLYVRTNTQGLLVYSLSGVLTDKVGQGVVSGWYRGMCMDTTRDVIVVTQKDKILSLQRTGKVVREITVQGARSLQGVVYCDESDLYVVTDITKHCVWFVDAIRDKVIKQVGSEGRRDDQFLSPFYLSHTQTSDQGCNVIVSDWENHSLKVFSTKGVLLRKIGCYGSKDRQLQYPCGVCVDSQRRVVVCDRVNKRVVWFWGEGDKEYMDVLLTSEQLGEREPFTVDITPGGHLLVGQMHSRHVMCFSYPG